MAVTADAGAPGPDADVYRGMLPGAINAKATRDGVFLFEFTTLPSEPRDGAIEDVASSADVVLEQTAVLNAHLACLHTALAQVQGWSIPKLVLSPADLMRPTSLDDANLGSVDTRVALLLLGRYPQIMASDGVRMVLQIAGIRKLEVRLGTIEVSFQRLAALLERDGSAGRSILLPGLVMWT